ncbi:UNVERIFIED_CONTAM: hypothetical protein Slati_3433700 [Sesamum latifolium]|uniref:Increased DNA methylation 1 C-terminal domain-containing protein n=1 Tax=Sesamum latifolium TaxID=2727402 RepID=A0AAW2UGW5_9LAMI
MFEKEKFAEPDANAIAAGRLPGVDPLEAITQRCIRVVGTLEPEIGGCAICRHHDFCKSRFTARTIIICDQCEKEYHVGCLKEKNIVDLKVCAAERRMVLWQTVQQYLSSPSKVDWGWQAKDSESSFGCFEMKCEGQSLQNNPELGIRWRLLRGKKATEDTRAWLSGAVHIFHEPLQRPGFLWHVLCYIDGRGYFQSLLYCIEGLLASLNVKDLVLPAADEVESMWRNRFGFEKLDQRTGSSMLTFYFMCILGVVYRSN